MNYRIKDPKQVVLYAHGGSAGAGLIDGVWHGLEPKKKEWVGLTDDAVFEMADTNLYDGGKNYGVLAFAKAIEQALKEKNT